ncbi:nucleoside phosphorylase [Xanthovirga aplysinae]|uniref:nucleoside phosphorylase n=1 Tax=Xanthovirga aplysinae TaxID=2529853 RepID=UPI001FE4C05D|nr:nucleoside phosphorylase [Xanthovirga aplysinae]
MNQDGSIYHLGLTPEEISDNIIVVGDPSRVKEVSKYFDTIELQKEKREFVTHTGTFQGKRITAISSGMGTDNVEILFTELDALASIDLENRTIKEEKRKLNIVRAGTSGALQPDIPNGSLLASDYGIGLDTLMYFYQLKSNDFEKKVADSLERSAKLPFKPYCVKGSQHLKEQFGEGMIIGNTVTCPGFYAPQGRILRLPLNLPDLIQNLNQFRLDQDFRITNFEMETAGYYAMARLLDHEMLSVNAIVANRITNEFVENAGEVVDEMIRLILNRF